MRGDTRKERVGEIVDYSILHGDDEACKTYNVKPASLDRYKRMYKEHFGESAAVLMKLKTQYSIEELKVLSNGKGLNPATIDKPSISFAGEEVCIAHVTDTHIGEETFKDYLWDAFLQECKNEGVQMIMHTGDVLEGMSNRPDQIYHLTDVGFSAQLDHAERLFKMTDIPIKCIDGNHDRWGIKSSGLFAIRDLAQRCNHVEFVGSDCGDVIVNGTVWRLWHGEDGSSYASSYRLQKIIEAFTGGDKPFVLLAGHSHKYVKLFERNIWAVSGGALSYQSSWMRATRKACHTGFTIIHATIRDKQVVKFSDTFYPFYK
jgi:predicted phosphodiesterase